MIFHKGGSPLITRQLQRRLRLMAGPVLVVALCCAFIPYSTDVSPAIELKVVGIDGNPLSDGARTKTIVAWLACRSCDSLLARLRSSLRVRLVQTTEFPAAAEVCGPAPAAL